MKPGNTAKTPLAFALLALLLSGAALAVEMPPNLVKQRHTHLFGPDQPQNPPTLSASSFIKKSNEPGSVSDGNVAGPLCINAKGTSWCVDDKQPRENDSFTMEWKSPVTVAEIICMGKVLHDRNDPSKDKLAHQFKDYEVYIDDAKQPLAVSNC